MSSRRSGTNRDGGIDVAVVVDFCRCTLRLFRRAKGWENVRRDARLVGEDETFAMSRGRVSCWRVRFLERRVRRIRRERPPRFFPFRGRPLFRDRFAVVGSYAARRELEPRFHAGRWRSRSEICERSLLLLGPSRWKGKECGREKGRGCRRYWRSQGGRERGSW